jgi:hypothetical protein
MQLSWPGKLLIRGGKTSFFYQQMLIIACESGKSFAVGAGAD